ncbi:helix-turn-helix domain-containing protein [Streptococcus uberis]|uniref:helix-turn-helix domain-containing protein n=1 Tax=Streptococcus uberis TaxID=1349 RepID=UPI001939A681|nr:helix-turn-helix transcriptional regulator [Streptococcus uberis]MCK1228470.1 helix-turn-helix domain-containing protein [Streptococcus uberis]
MSQQHKTWLEEVQNKLDLKKWSRSDLAQVVGVSPAMITQLFNSGKGSDDLKLVISKKLGIREPWEKFED